MSPPWRPPPALAVRTSSAGSPSRLETRPRSSWVTVIGSLTSRQADAASTIGLPAPSKRIAATRPERTFPSSTTNTLGPCAPAPNRHRRSRDSASTSACSKPSAAKNAATTPPGPSSRETASTSSPAATRTLPGRPLQATPVAAWAPLRLCGLSEHPGGRHDQRGDAVGGQRDRLGDRLDRGTAQPETKVMAPQGRCSSRREPTKARQEGLEGRLGDGPACGPLGRAALRGPRTRVFTPRSEGGCKGRSCGSLGHDGG
jgi:hypothetical protein